MKFQICDRDTLLLMPPSINDWLKEEHLARFIVDMIDEMDLSVIEAAFSEGGRPAYPVPVILGLLFYGYITGVTSSRKIEEATHDSVPFRYIAANHHPDHTSISRFRKRFLNELTSIFIQILLIANEMGVLKLGNLITDGSKILANASKHKALSWKYMKKLEAKFEAEIKELNKMAQEGDNIPKDMNIPEEIKRREERLPTIKEAIKTLKARAGKRYAAEKAEFDEKIEARKKYEEETGKKKRGRAPKPPIKGPKKKDQVNLTDKESRIMKKSGGGFDQAFNAQISIDMNSRLIVGNHVTNHVNDKKELIPAIEEVKKTEAALGQQAEKRLFDSGYYSANNVIYCNENNISPLIPDKRDKHNKDLKSRFKHLDPKEIPKDADPVSKMKCELQTKEGKELYAKRKTIESVFGIIKHVMGFRQFSLRTLNAVNGEFILVSIAYNLKRLHKLALEQKKYLNQSVVGFV